MKYVWGIAAALFFAAVTSFAGDLFSEGTLKPSQLARVEVPVQAHERVSIRVQGNGGDMDCYLYHGKEPGLPFGKFITRDVSDKDGCDIAYSASTAETLVLLVQNGSDHDEHYAITALCAK